MENEIEKNQVHLCVQVQHLNNSRYIAASIVNIDARKISVLEF
jgi:hypothetical protein